MAGIAIDETWDIPGGPVLATTEVFSGLDSGELSPALACRSAAHPEWRPLGERFRIIGPYGILRSIGEGAYGKILLGFRIGSSAHPPRLVALKSPASQARGRRAELGQAFSKEAALTARLAACDSVVKVLDHDVTVPFIALEYCNNGSLAERMKESYELADVLAWGQQLAEALTLAHGLKPDHLVHRDLKPENLLLHDGRIKVADFGTSKLARPESMVSTQRGGYTPLYAAPEAFEGRVLPATDIWSAGVILYELLAGHPPFEAEELPRLLYLLERSPPALGRESRIPTPKPLERLVLSCLQRDPERRPSAAELGGALKNFAEGRVAAPRKKGAFLALIGLLTLLLGTGALIGIPRSEPERPAERPVDLAEAPKPKSPLPPPTQEQELWRAAEEAARRLEAEDRRRQEEAERERRRLEQDRARLLRELEEIIAPLLDREAWVGTEDAIQDRIIGAVAALLQPEFRFVETRRFTCGELSHRLGVFRHEASEILLHLLPGGAYTMGSDDGRKGEADEQPRHPVRIRRPFLMGAAEVSQAQWDRIGGADSREFKGPERPIDSCSWLAVQDWLAKAGGGLRLPSEAEWEYACRAGSKGRTFFSRVGGSEDYVWSLGTARFQTQAVGQTRPNAFGLSDMLGNLWEWCADDYIADYADGPDTEAPRRRGSRHRVCRGGSYQQSPLVCLSSSRDRNQAAGAKEEVGFRVARGLPAP